MEKKSCDVFGQCCRPQKSEEETGRFFPDSENQQSMSESQAGAQQPQQNYGGYFLGDGGNHDHYVNMDMRTDMSMNEASRPGEGNQGIYMSSYQPDQAAPQANQFDSYFQNGSNENQERNYQYTYNVLDASQLSEASMKQAYSQEQNQNQAESQNQAYEQAQNQAYEQAQNQAYEQAQNQAYEQAQNQAFEQNQSQAYAQAYEQAQNQAYVQAQAQAQNQAQNEAYRQAQNEAYRQAYAQEQMEQVHETMAHPQSQLPSEQYAYEGGEQRMEAQNRPLINIKGDQPVFTVPVYQDKYLRDKFIEVPKYEIQDVVQPKLYQQETRHEIPTVELIYKEKPIEISQPRIVEKPVEVSVPIGYAPLYEPKWDVREVPRPVPKYQGTQKIIEVEVPQIKYIDKFVEKEIVVDVKEKIVPKITEIEKPVDVVRYQWKEQYQDVPVYKYVPKIDVELECPPPLIVPYPEPHFQNSTHVVNPNQTAADIPKEVLMKNLNISKVSNVHVNEQMKKSLLEIARSSSTSKPKESKPSKWAFWRSKKTKEQEEKEKFEEIDPETGYPRGMPKDFAHFFQKDLNSVKRQMQTGSDNRSNVSAGNANLDNIPVHPTVEYLGKIDKAPIQGGRLDSISFKLHAIEVHQFIPVPSLPKPKFLDLVTPEKIENKDTSCLENVFGSVPEGWVDPSITGYIAPMMQDVLQGNIKTDGPLFNKITVGKSKLQLLPLSSLNKRSTSGSVENREVQASNRSYRREHSISKSSVAYN